MTDSELLDSFSAGKSQDAFAGLVRRHIDLIYSAARRQTRDLSVADDITQAVFIILAQKTAEIDRRIPLTAWLLKTTHFACRDELKRRLRRTRHEQAAAAIAARREQAMNRHDSAAELPERIGAELDGALAALSDRDRGAVMLRYLNGMSVGETAAALCVSPEAAGKRIARALERLRQRLLRRGVIVPALGMAAALQGIPHFSATPALAGAVASSSLIPAASTAPAAIAKGTVQLMNWIKLKIAATILISAAVAAAATGTVALLQQSPAPADPAPAAPAPANPPPAATGAAGTFKVVLANGVSFELLGIAENPSRGKAWWKADGSPLSSPPYSRFDARMDAPNQLVREVAVLINPALIQASLPADVRWNLVGNGSRSSADPHPAVKGLEASAFIVADDPAGCTVRATVAAGEWATQYTIDGFGNHSESHAGPFGLGKKSFLCGPAITDHGKTRITAVSSGLGGDDLDVRMVAIDDTGRTYPAQTTGFISDSAVIIGEFLSDLPPASIKQWEFQTRPFDQWIEIRHVAVHPGQNTSVQIVTSDGG